MEKWKLGWKTGLLIVVCCVAAGLLVDIIHGKTVDSIIINSFVAAIFSSFGVLLVWYWSKRRKSYDEGHS